MTGAQADVRALGYERGEDRVFPDGFVLLGYEKRWSTLTSAGSPDARGSDDLAAREHQAVLALGLDGPPRNCCS